MTMHFIPDKRTPYFSRPVEDRFVIEYESGGKWYFWKYASSRKRAEELIAGRTNPVSLCRIRENK